MARKAALSPESASGQKVDLHESSLQAACILQYAAETQAAKTRGHTTCQSTVDASKAWTNSRKRPHQATSNHGSTNSNPDLEQDAEQPLRAPKRTRAADWPLKNTETPHADATPPVAASPPSRRKRQSKKGTRSSKFKEGSLGDKPSKVPPASYIGEEDAMERYVRQDKTRQDVDMKCDAVTETSKHSGMFRFGKAIASALNPTAVWYGINGMWKEKGLKPSPEKSILDQRQEKAAVAYAELKRNGYRGTQSAYPTRAYEGHDAVIVKQEEDQDSRRSSFRDSAVDLDESKARNSNESLTNGSLKPSAVVRGGRSVSPYADANPRRKSSLHLRTPSFQSLKKVKSHMQLPSAKRQTETSPLPTIELNQFGEEGSTSSLARQPSKRDISKQFKLGKRVSDLENKLELARRELEQSIHNAPPVSDLPNKTKRKPFTPGNLPSLPSERLLMGPDKNMDTGMDEYRSTPGPQPIPLPGDQRLSASGLRPRPASSWLDIAPEASTKGGDKVEHAAIWRAAKQGRSARKIARRRSQAKTSTPGQSPQGITKRLPKPPSNTPNNYSPRTYKHTAPPIPVKPPTVFDPSKMDHEAIKALRAIPNPHVAALGRSYDDMANLRTIYPSAPETDLAAYISHLVEKEKGEKMKKMDHTSVTHVNRLPSPFLGPPASASPMRLRSRSGLGARWSGSGSPAPVPTPALTTERSRKSSWVVGRSVGMEGVGEDYDDDDDDYDYDVLGVVGGRSPVDHRSRSVGLGNAKGKNRGTGFFGADKPLPDEPASASASEEAGLGEGVEAGFVWDEDVF